MILKASAEIDRLIHTWLETIRPSRRPNRVKGYTSNPNAARYLQRRLIELGKWEQPAGKLDCLKICGVALKLMGEYTAPSWLVTDLPESLADVPDRQNGPLQPIETPLETSEDAPRKRRNDRAGAYNAFVKELRSKGIVDPKEHGRLWREAKSANGSAPGSSAP